MRLPHLTLFKSLVTTVAVSILGPGLALAEPLELNFNGLDDLGAGWAYEGWLIIDGARSVQGPLPFMRPVSPARRASMWTTRLGRRAPLS